METIRTTQAKGEVQFAIAEKVAELSRKKRLVFETLSDGCLSHERMIRRMANPNLKIVTGNWDRKIANKIKLIDNLHEVVCGNINEGIRKKPYGGAYAIWFDYCQLVEPWNGFFSAVAANNFDLIWVTFSAKKIGLVNSNWPKKNLKISAKELTTKQLSHGIIKTAQTKMRALGYIPFYAVTYVAIGGKMITMGFEKRIGSEVGTTKIYDFPPEKQNKSFSNHDNSLWEIDSFVKIISLPSLDNLSPACKATLKRRANKIEKQIGFPSSIAYETLISKIKQKRK